MLAEARLGRDRTEVGFVKEFRQDVAGALALEGIAGDENGHTTKAVWEHLRTDEGP